MRQLRSHPAFDSKLAAKVKKAAKGYVGAHEYQGASREMCTPLPAPTLGSLHGRVFVRPALCVLWVCAHVRGVGVGVEEEETLRGAVCVATNGANLGVTCCGVHCHLLPLSLSPSCSTAAYARELKRLVHVAVTTNDLPLLLIAVKLLLCEHDTTKASPTSPSTAAPHALTEELRELSAR